MTQLQVEALRSALDRIKSQTPKLNKVTDDAAATIKLVEDLLGSYNVGIGADSEWAEYGDEFSGAKLAYRRSGPIFRIVVVYCNSVDADGEAASYQRQDSEWREVESEPWSNAARGVKLATFATLPSLLNNLSARIDDTIRASEAASTTVSAMLQAIANPGAPTVAGGKRSGQTPRERFWKAICDKVRQRLRGTPYEDWSLVVEFLDSSQEEAAFCQNAKCSVTNAVAINRDAGQRTLTLGVSAYDTPKVFANQRTVRSDISTPKAVASLLKTMEGFEKDDPTESAAQWVLGSILSPEPNPPPSLPMNNYISPGVVEGMKKLFSDPAQ